MAFTLPDDVWSIPEAERGQHAKWTSDLCQMGERYFIRCVLQIPFTDQPGYYGWGAWAEVGWPAFERYLQLYEANGTNELVVPGSLAIQLPSYGATLNLPVLVQFESSTSRPTILFAGTEDHPLAQEARTGMSYARFHEVLLATGAHEP
jgi:hypothetical protein